MKMTKQRGNFKKIIKDGLKIEKILIKIIKRKNSDQDHKETDAGTNNKDMNCIEKRKSEDVGVHSGLGNPYADKDGLKSESFLSFSRSFSLEIITLWYLINFFYSFCRYVQ